MNEVFAAVVNSDSAEGRGPMIIIGLFSEEELAREAVKGRGVMGVGNGEVHRLKIWNSLVDFNKKKYPFYGILHSYGDDITLVPDQEEINKQKQKVIDKRKAIAKAKAKLTDEELNLLGIG